MTVWNLECALIVYDIPGSGDTEEYDYTICNLVKGDYNKPDDTDKRAIRT